MTIKQKTIFYAVMNIVMSTAMSITASLISGEIKKGILWQIPIGFLVGMGICFIIPFGKMSGYFIEKLKHRTTIKIALISAIFPAVINTFFISAVMTFINVEKNFFIPAFFGTLPLMILVGFIVGLAVSPLAEVAAGLKGAKK